MSTTNRERYWLLERRRCRSLAADERWVLDHFVCCEVPLEGDAAVALEVFTSREGAEAELRGMEILAARGGLFRCAGQSEGRFAAGEFNKVTSEEVIELLEPELLEVLEGSDVAYVLIDPPPVDGPIPGSLGLKAAPAFAGELRQRLQGTTINREHAQRFSPAVLGGAATGAAEGASFRSRLVVKDRSNGIKS